jgi:REP element-mobilizing transposase RayT
VYHITARGNRRQAIYVDDTDRAIWLSMTAACLGRYRWRCHGYCLLTNHFHLLVTTLAPTIGAGMDWLNGRYAQAFNRRHGYSGHLFEGRYGSVLVENDRHLLELSRYIALNPVRAGLCSDPADWPWSSYSAAAGLAAVPPFLESGWLIRMFADAPLRSQERFRTFVAEGIA